jgi:hypothetical protein
MELWSTSDPTQIASFLQQLQANNHNLDDMSKYNMKGWTDKQDGEYTVDTDKKMLYYSEGSVNAQHEVVITGKHINLGTESAGFLDATMDIFGKLSDVTGGAGKGMQKLTGSFRLTNGAYNGSKLSMRFYDTNWHGGGTARITTYNSASVGKAIGKGSFATTIIVGGIVIHTGYVADGGKFGYNTKVAIAKVVGGMAGTELGADVGAGIGVWFGGIGVVPGSIIGGAIGGFVGGWGTSEAAGAAAEQYFK